MFRCLSALRNLNEQTLKATAAWQGDNRSA